MTRILGIDPGSRVTGFGIVEAVGQRITHLASGCIRAEDETFPNRLRLIFSGVTEVIGTHRPEEIAVERVFVHRNPESALKLGQARGAALAAGLARDLPVFEYTPAQVKQAVTGRGAAAKGQVQHMVRVLLRLAELPQADAADALAVALCHGHIRQTLLGMRRHAGRT
jgi:crossover junction endodeoxyribonuclease RuvC